MGGSDVSVMETVCLLLLFISLVSYLQDVSHFPPAAADVATVGWPGPARPGTDLFVRFASRESQKNRTLVVTSHLSSA